MDFQNAQAVSAAPPPPDEVVESESEKTDRLISTKLPFELKIAVLKEYFREWASRGRLVNEMELCGDIRTSDIKLCEFYKDGYRHTLYARGIANFEITADEGEKNWSENSITSNHMLKTFDNIRHSKEFGPPLETFFFGHIVWGFHYAYQFGQLFGGIFRIIRGVDVSSNPGAACFFNKIKNIRLLATEWKPFHHLFTTVHYVLAKQDKGILKNLETLEIYTLPDEPFPSLVGQPRPVIDMKDMEDPEHETNRIRYLVTCCWEMVQKRQKLRILIKGPSNNTSYPRPATIFEFFECLQETRHPLIQREENFERDGFGYPVNETEQFLSGTSELLSGLKNLEFRDAMAKLKLGNPEGTHVQYHWQMKFAEEWKKICEKGVGGVDGYDVIYL